MRRADVTRDELEALVAEYRHVRAEHARAHRGGRVRRRLDRRLVQVDARFERLLREAVADAEVRRAWLEHLRNGAPAPAEPSAAAPPLVRDLGLTARGRRTLQDEGRPAGLAAPPVLRVSARGVGEQPRRYLERKLRRVLRLSPLPVIGARAVVAEERNPSLERPATAKATVEVRGQDVHAHAAAGSPAEAVDLLAERLSRRLRGLGRRRDAVRQGTGALEPGEWRHGGVAAPRPVDERELP